jgi:chemotaxis protein CheX
MADPITLTLPAAIDGPAAEALISELMALRGMPLDVDMSGLERIGGLGLQLLFSAEATWAADAQPIRFLNPTPQIEETLDLAGARSLLADQAA